MLGHNNERSSMKLPKFDWMQVGKPLIGYRARLVVKIPNPTGVAFAVTGDVRWAPTKRRLVERMEAECEEANDRVRWIEEMSPGHGYPNRGATLRYLRAALAVRS
jgi:hypothetical protein